MKDGGIVLVADSIGKTFGRQEVLKAASLRARKGEVVALVGRNGVGKTTLFRVVIGRTGADYGHVAYRGTRYRRPALHRLAAEGLMYSSQASALTSLFPVREHLSAFARTFGRSVQDVEEAVQEMRLGAHLDLRPSRLSGGERQRVSLALALLRRPLCLISDEPFAGVAPKDRPLIGGALRTLASAGCAVVISGHDIEDIFAVSDRIVWATAGTTHELGSPRAAREHFQFRREYLGPVRARPAGAERSEPSGTPHPRG